MADLKITELDAVTVPVDTDLVPTVQGIGTTPLTKKITWTVIKAFLKTYFDSLYQAVGTYLTSANIEDSIVDGHTTVAPSGNAVFDALALKASLVANTFTGLQTLATGTTTLAPLKFVAGTNLTTPVAGVIEFDGTDFFISI